jgi:uncharacterized protein (TIGR04222 family)
MNQDFSALVAKLEACQLDVPGSADPFSRRLARENGWTGAYARRVVREYTRFLALAVSGSQLVTPSEQVDQAWHMHVLYTARYREFCRDVLGRRLDHQPSDGGGHEQARYVQAYEQTLSAYQQLFGEAPPADIWPSSAQRFGTDLCVRRVNTAENWVLPKPRLSRLLEARYPAKQARVPLLFGALAAIGCSGDIGLSSTVSGPEFLHGFFWLWLCALAAAFIARQVQKGTVSGAVPTLEAYPLAQLAGGAQRAVDSATTALVARGALFFDNVASTLRVDGPMPQAAHALERRVYDSIYVARELDVDTLRRRAPSLTEDLATELFGMGLVQRASVLPLFVALLAPLWGCVRMLSRVGTDRPIAFLFIGCLAAAALAIWLFRPRTQPTALGEAVLRDARLQHAALRAGATAEQLAVAGTLPIALGLFGLAAVPGASGFTAALQRRGDYPSSSNGSSGSNCGTDCGDSGGGDGGGGGDSGGGCGGGGCGGCGGGGGD